MGKTVTVNTVFKKPHFYVEPGKLVITHKNNIPKAPFGGIYILYQSNLE